MRDNILFGFDETPGAVEAAARDAEIHDAILLLPQGYDTLIGGDSLTNMSGGQLQRLCLARALYRQPSLLLVSGTYIWPLGETFSTDFKSLTFESVS